MGERRDAYRVSVEKLEGKSPLRRPRRRWIFGKWDVRAWTALLWLRIGTVGGLM